MTACVADAIHLFQVLFVFDLIAYGIVMLDDYALFTQTYLNVNLAMTGLMLLQVFLPGVTYLRNAYMSGILGILIFTLFVFGSLAAAYTALISTVAIMLVFGFTLHYAQEFAIDWFGSSWGADLDTQTKLYVLASILAALIIVIALLYVFVGVSRFFIRSLIYSLLAIVATKAMWFNGISPDEICCNTSDPETCPIYIGPIDLGLTLVLFWIRMVSYTIYRYYYGTAEELKKAKALLIQNKKKSEIGERQRLLLQDDDD